jgi:hypothetical protein
MEPIRVTFTSLVTIAFIACGPGGLMSQSPLGPWDGPTVQVTEAEGNVLEPGTAYRGDWSDTAYFSFDFELDSMAAMEITAKDDRGRPDDLEVKLFSNYVELFSTVGRMPHDGVYEMRLPPGTYNLSLQLAPGVDPQQAGRWNLRVAAVEGPAALQVRVPETVLAKHQPAFHGNVLNLQGVLGDEPDFVDLMRAWTYISVPDYGSYVKPGTLLRPPNTDPAALWAGTAPGFELLANEPVVVYDLVDLFAARVVTADGLYGLVHVDDLAAEKPDEVQLPATLRVAEGYRMLQPDSAGPDRNGGLLALLDKIRGNKDFKKTARCVDSIDEKLAEEGLDLESSRLQVLAMVPTDPGYDSVLGSYVEARNAYRAHLEQCLSLAWTSFGQFITDEDRVAAAFEVLSAIRGQFGLEAPEVPSTPPPVLPSLVPPPPPPPELPAPAPAPAVAETPAPPQPAGEPAPEGQTSPPPSTAPGSFTFDTEPTTAPAPAAPAPAQPPPPPPAAPEQPAPPAPPAEEPPAEEPPAEEPPAEEPSPPGFQPIIPWAHVD